MPKWLRIILGLISSLIILLVIAALIFYRMLSASIPDYAGHSNSFKIKNKVEIYRDSTAIPYIIAQNDEDVAFALGYVHAQERMFTMDFTRRAGSGKLSEILGSETIPFDKMFLTVGIKRTAQMILNQMNPKSRKILESYSNGINYYLQQKKGNLPVEFDVLGYDPEEWTSLSSLIMIRMMAWELNVSWWTDISFTELIQKLGDEKVKEIFPNYPENAPVIMNPEILKLPKVNSDFVKTDKLFRKFMGWTGTHIGSNNWIVNGKMSSSGKPIIANDTHLAYSAPGIWFAAVIKSLGWNAAGFTMPGAPVIVIGKNENISWAVTNIMADEADFYVEKLDSTRTKYFYNKEWHNLKTIHQIIHVKDSADVEFDIKETEHGPLVSNIHPFNSLYTNKNLPSADISMRWLGNEISDEFTTFLRINKAKNWDEFKSAFDTYSVPGQNFIYGDEEGNIGYVFGARLPIRENNNTTFAVDGTDPRNDWKGFVPQNKLPKIFNPEANYLASANNKTEKDFNFHITNLWEPPSRIERITELISSKQKHSVADYKKYQMDWISPYARKIVPYILNAFNNVNVKDENLKKSLELFSDWNYEMGEFSQVPAIYAVFLNHLLKNIYFDEMGHDLYNEFVFIANVPYRSLEQVLSDSTNSWFDDIDTPQIETKQEIIRKSLSDALTELEQNYGKDLTNWQWGRMHKATFKHAFSGFSDLIDSYINIGPFEIGGDGTTIFNTEYPFYEGIKKIPRFDHKKFENNLGPAMRYIYDFSTPDKFCLILTTGESGNIMSDHYRDMTQMWLHGKYLTIRTDEKSIRNNSNLYTISPE